ncbi:MAG TPA: hypothetical protein VF043_09575, partial [Ktedonobacteraceae bacterium]
LSSQLTYEVKLVAHSESGYFQIHPIKTGKRSVYIMALNVYSRISNYINKENLLLCPEQSKI